MGSIDLHKRPFDEGTNCKLNIFENYVREWLPVMIKSKHYLVCCIYDLFAGPGYDTSGQPGSPIRILSQIQKQASNILQSKTKVGLWLNEADKNKFIQLVENCDTFIDSEPLLKQLRTTQLLKVNYTQNKFEDIFDEKILKALNLCPSLLFLDQNGIKHLNQFDKLVGIKHLDFLYFVSSSYYVRFGETKQFKEILDINQDDIRALEYKDIHEIITNELRNLIPPYSDMRIYPFSIKKDKNIYGIVFGSSNILGVEKFLRTTWNINPQNGTANFDIEDDSQKSQLDLFEGKLLTKIERFENDIQTAILSGEISNNQHAYLYTLDKGYLSSHAQAAINALKSQKKITFEGRTPAVNYKDAYKGEKIVEYKLLNK